MTNFCWHVAQIHTVCFLVTLMFGCGSAHAASFLFGTNAGGANGVIYGQLDRSSAQLTRGQFTATFDAAPIGALLDDRDAQGLGVDTSPLTNVSDSGNVGESTKFNVIDGTNPVSGQGESMNFSFDHSGVLKTLLFDGVKDETLEYFSLTLPNGSVVTIFDSQTEYRLSVQGYHLADLQVPNPVQAQTEDDDLTDINYPFSAGEVFTITYGEGDYGLIPDYHTNPDFPQFPNAVGNGARFQGVVVAVPEPMSSVSFLVAAAYAMLQLRRREPR
jgi:hypothetical protein